MKTVCCNTRHYHKVDKTHICLMPTCTNYLGYTQVTRDLRLYKNALASLLFIASILFTFDDFSKSIIEPGLPVERELVLPLNAENLIKEIENTNIICKEAVFAQMMLESGNLKSFLLQKTNNMLGMRYPAQRPTIACGIFLPGKDTIIYGTQEELRKYTAMNNYAVYAKWQDAVADYKIWQEKNFKLGDTYLEFLGRVYAEDKQYVQKIKKGMN